MLLRVVPVIGGRGLGPRLNEILCNLDCTVVHLDRPDVQWDELPWDSGDLFLISIDRIPDPRYGKINEIRRISRPPCLVVLTEEEDPERRALLLASGCEAVLNENLPRDSMHGVLAALVTKLATALDRALLPRRQLGEPNLEDFVSSSYAMRAFMDVVRRVASSDSSLLLMGETGVGKERLARGIHAESRRAGGPFIAVNCGALTESLLESELFGHEKGAFTGAVKIRRGCFELAHNGTIFLDEIGELPLHLQVKLLRVLQDKEVARIGGEGYTPIDVRVMAASNRNLEEEVNSNRFRSDLFFRLNVVSLTLPPLRERREDIAELAESYLHYLRPRVGRDVSGFTPQTMAALEAYSWPGNVRELVNVIERAMLVCRGEVITLSDLPPAITTSIRTHQSTPVENETLCSYKGGEDSMMAELMPSDWVEKSLPELRKRVIEKMEKMYLASVLERKGGRIGESARHAGIEPRSLYAKMRRYGIQKEDFKRVRRKG